MINKIDAEVNKVLNKVYKSYKGVSGSNYNALLSFVVYSGTIQEDEYGNYKPSESETIEIKAKVRSMSPDKAIQDIGLDKVRDYYQLWFVNPLTYDKEIPITIDCQILQNGIWLKGKFNVTRNNISNQNEITQIRNSLGYALEGYFEQDTTQRG